MIGFEEFGECCGCFGVWYIVKVGDGFMYDLSCMFWFGVVDYGVEFEIGDCNVSYWNFV